MRGAAPGMSSIHIDWEAVMPAGGESPVRVLEVVSSSDSGLNVKDDGEEFQGQSDQQLEERAARLREFRLRSRLPDGGAKLRASCDRIMAELERRRSAKLAGPSKRTSLGNESVYDFNEPDIDNFICNQKYGSLHLKKRDRGAFDCELKDMSQSKRLSPTKESLRKPIPADKMYSCKNQRSTDFKSSYHKPKDTRRSFLDGSSCKGRILENRGICPSVKRKSSKIENSPNVEFEKVKEVVFLDDDEDLHTIESDPTGISIPCNSMESKLYYPSRDDPEAVELTYADLKCLEPEVFLSSSVINFYIQYIKRTISHFGGSQENFHIFNTFFYSKLEEALQSQVDQTSHFLKLRRWWRGVDIFHKAYLLMPIHGKDHWSLIIICNPAKDTDSGPFILHLDSLGLHTSSSIFEVVGRFLEEEWKYLDPGGTLKDLPFNKAIWNNLSSKLHNEKISVPQQRNMYDCGIFVLYYIELFIRHAPERMRKQDLDMFGRRWFKPDEASQLRQRIRELLTEEFESICVEDGIAGDASSSDNSANEIAAEHAVTLSCDLTMED